MVDITPKALRFARLAAEQQAAFSSDPMVALIRQEESAFALRPSEQRVRGSAEVSEATAEFCLRAVEALLASPDLFSSMDWDGNDYAFLQAVTRSLHSQLALSPARP